MLTNEQIVLKEVYMEVLADRIANIDKIIINNLALHPEEVQKYRNYLRDCLDSLRSEGNYEEITKYRDILDKAKANIIKLEAFHVL